MDLVLGYGNELRRDDGAELDWPFDAAMVAEWASGSGLLK